MNKKEIVQRAVIFGRNWKLSVLEQPAVGKNQDAWLIGENCVVVVDGATPLDDTWPQDVGDFARAIADSMIRLADSSEMATIEVWENSILELRKVFAPSGYLRSASVLLLRRRGDLMEFSSLGDVIGIVRKSNISTLVRDETIPSLDDIAKNIGGNEILIEHRKNLNTDKGYWIFADDVNAAKHLMIHSFRMEDRLEILMSSDGFFRGRQMDPALILGDVATFGLIPPHFESSSAILDSPDDVTVIHLEIADSD